MNIRIIIISIIILKQWIALKVRSDWLLNSEYPLLFTSKELAHDLRPKILQLLQE